MLPLIFFSLMIGLIFQDLTEGMNIMKCFSTEMVYTKRWDSINHAIIKMFWNDWKRGRKNLEKRIKLGKKKKFFFLVKIEFENFLWFVFPYFFITGHHLPVFFPGSAAAQKTFLLCTAFTQASGNGRGHIHLFFKIVHWFHWFTDFLDHGFFIRQEF